MQFHHSNRLGIKRTFIHSLLSISSVLFCASEAFPQLVIDTVTVNSGVGNIHQHLHQVSGTKRLLLVVVQNAHDENVSKVEFGGQSLTLISTNQHPNGSPLIEIWEMVNPPLGTDTVYVELNGGGQLDTVSIGAVTFNGVKTSNPIDTIVNTFGTGTFSSITLSTNRLTIFEDFLASHSVGIPTAGGSQVQLWSVELGGTSISGRYGTSSILKSPDSAVMDWTMADSTKDWVHTAIGVIADSCAANFKDEFINISYDNNNGSVNWTTPWTEIGESDGVNSGLCRVVNTSQMSSPNSFRLGTVLGVSLGNHGIVREANLGPAGTAQLSYSYRREGYNALTSAKVEISSDGGSGWTTIQTIPNGTDATEQLVAHDISSYISKQTQIKISTDGALTVDGYIHFDDFEISFDYECGAPPFIVLPEAQVVDENDTLQFVVYATDADGVLPALTALNLPVNATFLDEGSGKGVFTFAPDYTQSGSYNVTFIASDSLQADTGAVLITVDNINRPPVLSSIGDKAVDENSLLNINITGTDPDGQMPSFSVENNPVNSVFADNGNGTAAFNFTPDFSQAGSYDVLFIASDGNLSDSEVITITVNDINRPPVITPINDTSIDEGTNISFDVLSTDLDGTIPELSAINLPANALFIDENDGSGTFVFMPGYTQAGVYDVSLIASDGIDTDTETVQITVNDASPNPANEVIVTTIPIGYASLVPNSSQQLILAFKLQNFYSTTKTIVDLTVRDAGRGYGTLAERLMNVDSIRLYLDKNGDMVLTAADSLIANHEYSAGNLTFGGINFPLQAGGSSNLLVGVKSDLFPRDGDTLDIYLKHSTDIVFSTATATSGIDSVNSFGIGVFNGMVAAQIDVVPVGSDTISPSDSMEILSTFNIPRNGYADDTLQVFSLLNLGTAQGPDFDSLVLFLDDGNSSFDGAPLDTRIGQLIFTGGQWAVSGLNTHLSGPINRFFVAARVSQFPNNGATFRSAIPQNGLQMKSGNDGPYDSTVNCTDTIIIQTFESIDVKNIAMAGRVIIPGQSAGNIFAFQLTNSFSFGVALDSMTLSLLATDPQGATQNQLDSQIDSIVLHHELDGDLSEMSVDDSVLASATVSNGIAQFALNGLSLSAFGGTEIVTAELFLNLNNAKNNNLINLSIGSAADLVTTPAVTVSGAFPFSNPKNFTINAFPAKAITINTVPSQSIFAGQTNQVVMNFVLPSNGYANDSLRSMQLINIGTLEERAALTRVRLFQDLTGDGFSIGDRLIGNFSYRDPYWELTNLTQLIVPPGANFLVLVDAANSIFDGGTLDFRIPIQGVTYTSTTNGPDDAQVGNPNSHLVFPPNRVTAISIPAPSTNIFPGSSDNGLLTFALYNGYVGQNQTLQGIILTNISRSISGLSYSDFELGQIALYADNNKNRIRDDDSLIATGSFSSGKLQFNGLNQSLPAESLSYFFIESSVPLNIIDSDSLSVSINSLSDLIFPDSVNVNGDVPVSSDGFLIINGSVADQYELLNVQPTTLRPGDSLVPVFAFKPAFNGNRVDTLDVLTISNSGDADNTDISSMSLWLDMNSDEIWQISDSLIGQFTYAAGSWTIGSIQLEVASASPSLFVLASIDSLATNGTTFNGRIPINGCQYYSANDGPVDDEVNSDDEFTISASGLRVSLPALASTYSIGQTIPVSILATNLNPTSMDSVSGFVVSVLDSSIISLDSSFAGPVTLNTGDTGIFSFYYNADSIGTTNWGLRAIDAASAESSAVLQTPVVTIQSTPNQVPLSFINSIPTAVTKGQLNVFPLSIKILHPDSTGTSASIRIDSLQLLVEDGSANPISANTALSNIVLNSGFQTISVIDTVPAQSSFWLVFNQPVIIGSASSVTFSLLVDIDSLATAANFALAISNSSFVPLTDFNSGQSISLSSSLIFPLRTASCRIEDPSTQMAVSSQSVLPNLVNYGQQEVGIIQLDLRHPGALGSSQVQLTGLSFEFLDTSGAPLIASELFDNIAVSRQSITIGDLFGAVPADSRININLNSPVTLNPGEVVSIVINADLNSTSVHDGFSLTISDSTEFVVRELSSGSSISAVTDTVVLSTGSAFPMFSTIAEMRQPAQAPQFCISSNLPPSVNSGADSLSLIGLMFVYSVAPDYSPLRLNELSLTVRDSSGTVLNPDDLFDKIGYSRTLGTISYQPFVQIFGSSVMFKFEDSGVLINPGDSIMINLVADLEADIPYDHFVLQVNNSSSLTLTDATDTTNIPGILFAPGCGSSFPFITSPTEIFLPAGKPTLTVSQYPVQIAFPGQSNMTMLDGFIDYQSATPLGDLSIIEIVGRIEKRSESGLVPYAGTLVFNSISIELDGVPVAVDSVLTEDSVIMTLAAPYSLSRGQTVTAELLADIKPDAALGNFVISFDDSTSFVIEDADLGTPIAPLIAGATYPVLSTEISVVAADLSTSFTNFPNPFNPARGEETTIGFVLTQDGYVNIDIYSITGELVRVVALNEYRASGTYQSDVWAGLNDVGLNVIPGTYFCRIYVKYASGKVEEFKRKIAVVR